jgi:hypothetical protein
MLFFAELIEFLLDTKYLKIHPKEGFQVLGYQIINVSLSF